MIEKLIKHLSWWHIMAAGLAARLAVCGMKMMQRPELGPITPESLQARGNDGFIQLAYNLLHHGVYALEAEGPRVPFRPPLTSLLMIPFGAVLPEHWYLLWTFAIGMMAFGTIWATHDLLKEMGVSHGGRLLGTAVVSLHPYMIYACWVPNGVTVSIFMFTMAFWALSKAWKRGGVWNAVLGVALGLACLSHGSAQALVPCFCAAFLVRKRKTFASNLGAALSAGIVCLLTISPWTYSNEKSFGMRIPVATGSGLQYWLASENYAGTFTGLDETFAVIEKRFEERLGKDLVIRHGGLLDPATDNELVQLAIHDLKNDIPAAMKRYATGVAFFWAYNPRGVGKSVVKALTSLPVFLACVAALAFAVWKRSVDRLSVAGLVAAGLVMSLFAMIQATEVYYLFILPIMSCCAIRLYESAKMNNETLPE